MAIASLPPAARRGGENGPPLRENEREPLFADAVGQPFAGAGETVFLDDAPEHDEDSLGRADLAFMLAARLNRIWDEMNESAAADTAGSDEAADDDTGQGRGYDAGFVVHIDAPWGGGKTSFANYLMRILNPYCLPPPLPDVLQAIPLGDPNYWPVRFRRPWHIVTFNAWQHQHVDPPWWCFYQAIRRQCFHATRTEAWDFSDNRLSPPTAGWPGIWELRQARWLGHWARELLWRLFHPKIRTLLAIAVPTLVIAALAIRFGLFSFDATNQKWIWSFDSWPPLVLGGASLVLGGASAIWAFVSVITESLFPGTPAAAKNYSLGSGDPLERFRTHFANTMSRLKRPVLVVVDDIDRREPKLVVELIRGMQTILRSPRVVFLLLGDRDWIEHAFAETHKAMKGIDVGPEHSFGGRFVEKAIQLSIVLPDIPPEERSDYVRMLLGVDKPPANPVEQLAEEHRQEIEETLETLEATQNPALRDMQAAEIRKRIFEFETASDEVKEAVAKSVDRKAALRSAADEKVQAATQHRLEPISGVLPPNPRQIKRIINAIALFQEIARTRLEIQPETQRWRQLALWIVLMTEWPQSWTTLAKWPDLVTRVHNPTMTGEIDGLDEATAKDWADKIRDKPDVTKLLNYPAADGVPDGWQDCKIDAEAVRDLTVILPPTSGDTLPKPEPSEKNSAEAKG